MNRVQYFTVRLSSYSRVKEIREWADVNGVGFWWNGENAYDYTFLTDECTMALIKLKFGEMYVVR